MRVPMQNLAKIQSNRCIYFRHEGRTMLTMQRLLVQACRQDPDTPAGLLVSASKYYQDRDPRCETLLESIRQMSVESTASTSRTSSPKTEAKSTSGALATAVADVVFVAGWMPKTVAQKELLRAALYGRTHAPQDIDTALIPLCVLHARVLNSLRKASGVCSSTCSALVLLLP